MFVHWKRTGEHWIWLNAMAITICIIMVVGLIGLIIARGMVYFWPNDVVSFNYTENNKTTVIAGEIIEDIESRNIENTNSRSKRRLKIKSGNRDIQGLDFGWYWFNNTSKMKYPEELVVIERVEWGNFYGYFDSLLNKDNKKIPGSTYEDFNNLIPEIEKTRSRKNTLERYEIGAINKQIENIRLEKRKLELDGDDTKANLQSLFDKESDLKAKYKELEKELLILEEKLQQFGAVQIKTANGQIATIQLRQIIAIWQPNKMSTFSKVLSYLHNIYIFISSNPREANTEGGIFPAIFGTVIMVLLMTIFTTPMGVIAAIYMREYAKQGTIIRIIRICVNNLAGVPSIVYGVFGLGFFVYFLGGNIDALFYPEALPAPTFGTPGLLWASLTLALLTLPVVIVSTEEGLTRIPIAIREGSMALGATKFETLYKVILPLSSPAIMTGMILAVARAAGEVAPLMLVGVVKLAPDLVIDSTAPFLHLERKFMHLGFHIFDVGFQSPNVDAATPLVYATSFLLLLVIIALNLTAILIRNRLREKYKKLDV